ncbi:MAG: glutamine synthetase III [Eubacteriales bacterium]|jgi:glutamine synthetase|nr:glutamine synthetase III [Eubacteriales bacterium]
MPDLTSNFGSMVFGDRAMRERLPEDAYASLHRTIADGRSLNITLANTIADAMKVWAIELGATHYTHWFQPMTGITAEKHESFITPDDKGGAMVSFSGSALIRGESDASSFPSGGLRATFEARGYTAWDPTSYAFIKDNTLCIPTAFCSYGGEALDKKTPLMRSMETLNKQALRILRLFGDDTVKRVHATVGAEQEYFLIDKTLFDRRSDLILTGRTLFGARPPKGQELDDHYYGAIKPRVKAFMSEVNEQLWKLGISSKTEHNEAAPSQYELAPVFTTVNIAADQNQLTMEILKKTALRLNFVCVLHEKPFEGVNGSGKHVNWSLMTDSGQNLLNPGDTPCENIQFLLFLSAIIRAVDDYQDLLRISVAGAGNDCRLGRSEAPPAIISMFLGDELTGILNALESGNVPLHAETGRLETRVHVLPKLPRDSTDRNRTSPFAFTGNKFEFRMPGSSVSIAEPNIMINTIVAESLSVFADRMEADLARGETLSGSVSAIVIATIREHRRILFNGNNYSADWVREAENRGLLNLPSAADAIPCLISEKNIGLFTRHRVFSEAELRSRYEILLDDYCKKLNIEALTIAHMIKKELLPAGVMYLREVSETAVNLKELGLLNGESVELITAAKLSRLCRETELKIDALRLQIELSHAQTSTLGTAQFVKDKIIPAMSELRRAADTLEAELPDRCIPYPTYEQLLFSE